MIQERFSVEGPTGIEVVTSSGSVVVEEGAPGSVEVEVDTRQPDAWRVRQTGTTVHVSYERGLAARGGRARVRIVAPAGSSLDVTTASADVRVIPELARTSVATASGDIYLGDCASASLKTASGEVRVGTVNGDLVARSASGDIRIREVGGRAGLTTVSGDVQVERVDGDLVVSTASGDVRIGRYAGEDLEASTISGDLWLGMPRGRTVKLDAKTLSGSVRLPERKQPSSAPGPMVSLRLKSVSGDIRITRLD